jgi:hypothetical protein
MRTASPAVQVVCFDAGAVKAEFEPGVLVTGHETDLISTVAGLYHSRDRIEICGEPGLQDRVAHIRSLVDTAVEYAVAMEATIRSRSQGWIDLGLTLLPLIAGRPAVQSLGPGWAGRPAIVVGAGPSLEDDLETLRGISDRALIVAASSAAGALARGGVVPHAWACAEERHEASSELAGSYQGSWLIPGTHCHEAFWHLDPDRTIPCVMATTGIGTFLARIFGLPTLSTGGSVTTVCFALARQLGADPIILVGQDCVMASLSQTHAARSEERRVGKEC